MPGGQPGHASHKSKFKHVILKNVFVYEFGPFLTNSERNPFDFFGGWVTLGPLKVGPKAKSWGRLSLKLSKISKREIKLAWHC